MNQTSHLVITISHQFGCGGAYLSQKVAEKLNMLYVNRQIIDLAAQKLNISTDEVASRDEKPTSFLQSLIQSSAYINTSTYIPPESIYETNNLIYSAQEEVILEIYKKKSAVIIGRCSSHILRSHPHHVSIFLYADISYRQKRIQQINNISEQEALKLVTYTDKTRALYIREITGHDLKDACQYHLSLDTSILGLDKTEKVILTYLHSRFGEIVIQN